MSAFLGSTLLLLLTGTSSVAGTSLASTAGIRSSGRRENGTLTYPYSRLSDREYTPHPMKTRSDSREVLDDLGEDQDEPAGGGAETEQDMGGEGGAVDLDDSGEDQDEPAGGGAETEQDMGGEDRVVTADPGSGGGMADEQVPDAPEQLEALGAYGGGAPCGLFGCVPPTFAGSLQRLFGGRGGEALESIEQEMEHLLTNPAALEAALEPILPVVAALAGQAGGGGDPLDGLARLFAEGGFGESGGHRSDSSGDSDEDASRAAAIEDEGAATTSSPMEPEPVSMETIRGNKKGADVDANNYPKKKGNKKAQRNRGKKKHPHRAKHKHY